MKNISIENKVVTWTADLGSSRRSFGVTKSVVSRKVVNYDSSVLKIAFS